MFVGAGVIRGPQHRVLHEPIDTPVTTDVVLTGDPPDRRRHCSRVARFAQPRFAQPIVGIPMRMDKLTRLRHAQQRIVRVQRRVWLVQVLMWPTVIAAGVSSVGGLVWILRRRYAGGRHEMPDTPGAHEVGTVQIKPDGRLSHV